MIFFLLAAVLFFIAGVLAFVAVMWAIYIGTKHSVATRASDYSKPIENVVAFGQVAAPVGIVWSEQRHEPADSILDADVIGDE